MEISLSSEILSLVALVIALSSTVINYLVLRLQRDPEVVVYALPDPRRPAKSMSSLIDIQQKALKDNLKHEDTKKEKI